MSPQDLPREVEQLLEAATTAHRERDPSGRIKPSPAWADLSPEHREALFERQFHAREIERALHAEALTTTARTVLKRARQIDQLPR